jgi:hypothetical protein
MNSMVEKLRSLAALDKATGTRIQVNNSALALHPSRHRALAMLARHKRQRMWFDIIGEELPHSRDLASSTSALRATINDYITIVFGRLKIPGTAGESIITEGIPKAMATGPQFVRRPPWSLSPTASVVAGRAEDDMVHARLQRKWELADFAVGRQPAVANLNC